MSQSAMSLIMLVGIIAIMYFLMIRPQRKKEKEITAMRNSIQVGDEIVTIGGFFGKVMKTKEESLIIQLGNDKTKVEIMRWGVSKVSNRTEQEEVEEAPVKKPARPKRMKVNEEPAAAPEEASDIPEEVVEEAAPEETKTEE